MAFYFSIEILLLFFQWEHYWICNDENNKKKAKKKILLHVSHYSSLIVPIHSCNKMIADEISLLTNQPLNLSHLRSKRGNVKLLFESNKSCEYLYVCEVK